MPPVSSIRVGVRARPLAFNELHEGCQSCVGFPGGNDIIIGGTKQFSFDHVFSDQATQEEIYKLSVRDMINNLFVGYNVTVLAYGQTGSGKTYTMGTNFSDITVTQNSGVIPRAIKDIYDYLNPLRDTASICVKVSFIEVYNEEIFDLLSNTKQMRFVREENQDIKIPNLIEQCVDCSDDIFKCLMKGSENRVVGSTAMNETSSRSHAIFTIHISILPLPESTENGMFEPISSKLHLVDLAGSERPSKTLATGDRFKEGVNINKGLLALGNVISSLVEKDKHKNKHVPYRESKLTRLLQDSLGGNTKTLMLACISPADSNFEETSTTLNYAARARQIQNKPIINKVDSIQGEVYQLRAQVTALQAQLKHAMGNGIEIIPSLPSNISPLYFSEMCELKAEISGLKASHREKFKLLEEFDEELTRRDDLLKRVYGKISLAELDKDDTYLELEKLIVEMNKSEHADVIEHSEYADQSTEENKFTTNEKNDILKCLHEELRSKEAHLQQIESIDVTLLQQYEEKNRELLQRIKELEEEKLRNNPKHRQDDLELRLKDARKQLHELNILKKEKEHNSNEVKQLRLKIDELKKSICKVTKELQKEKDNFRKITAEKEKQYKSLQNKDRILQTQMEKQAVQHAKETAVLRRKMESCTAEGKRLKEILACQKKNATRRVIRTNTNKNIPSQVKYWIRQSLELAAERCETRQRFNILIEDRRKLTEQLGNLSEVDSEEKYQLQLEIKRLNECISQLQQVELTEGLDDLQVQACWNQLRNINECRIAIRFMFRQLVQERVNQVMAESELQRERMLVATLQNTNEKLECELDRIHSESEKSVNHKIKKRRTSLLFESNRDAKRQKRCSDTESISSSVNSRLSSRLSQGCRCKNGCKPNRCGCLKSSAPCSNKCGCKGQCSEGRLSILPDIVENASDRTLQNIEDIDDGNILNRTFDGSSKNPLPSGNILNQSFTISKDVPHTTAFKICNIDEDKENFNNTIVNTDVTLTESLLLPNKMYGLSDSIENTQPTILRKKQYFDSPSAFMK